VQVRNVFGVDLLRVAAVPVSDVSCCAVDPVVFEDTAPALGLRARRRIRREWTMGLSLMDAHRSRVALLLGDALHKPDVLNLVARRLNRVVLDAHTDVEKAAVAMAAAAKAAGAPSSASSSSDVAGESGVGVGAGAARAQAPVASAAAHVSPPPLSRCVVCLSNPVTVAMLPCRHMCACIPCARSLVGKPCPICRVSVRETMRMFVT